MGVHVAQNSTSAKSRFMLLLSVVKKSIMYLKTNLEKAFDAEIRGNQEKSGENDENQCNEIFCQSRHSFLSNADKKDYCVKKFDIQRYGFNEIYLNRFKETNNKSSNRIHIVNNII